MFAPWIGLSDSCANTYHVHLRSERSTMITTRVQSKPHKSTAIILIALYLILTCLVYRNPESSFGIPFLIWAILSVGQLAFNLSQGEFNKFHLIGGSISAAPALKTAIYVAGLGFPHVSFWMLVTYFSVGANTLGGLSTVKQSITGRLSLAVGIISIGFYLYFMYT